MIEIPCGCGKSKKYQVTKPDGSQVVVETLSAAMAIIRSEGGRYQPIKV